MRKTLLISLMAAISFGTPANSQDNGLSSEVDAVARDYGWILGYSLNCGFRWDEPMLQRMYQSVGVTADELLPGNAFGDATDTYYAQISQAYREEGREVVCARGLSLYGPYGEYIQDTLWEPGSPPG